MIVIRHMIVHGRVQGIGYRAFVEHEALRRGIEGWVRNRRDGSVEALLVGTEEVVLTMVELCREGPPGAHVEAIDQQDVGTEGLALRRAGDLFSVLPTA